MAVLFASGVALAVTPLDDTAENTGAEVTAAAKGPDAALDRALKELVAMEGGPPGVIAVVQRGQHREVHAFGAAKLGTQWPRPPRVDDRMRIASAAKAFSGAVALSLVSKGALSLDDTIG
jgi:D-alanyl-D-alanine carboxypeptidase